jgi:hypothetical protein
MPETARLSARNRALEAIDLEKKIDAAHRVEGAQKEVRKLVKVWADIMDDSKVKQAYRIETAGVDPEIVTEELGRLAA